MSCFLWWVEGVEFRTVSSSGSEVSAGRWWTEIRQTGVGGEGGGVVFWAGLGCKWCGYLLGDVMESAVQLVEK